MISYCIGYGLSMNISSQENDESKKGNFSFILTESQLPPAHKFHVVLMAIVGNEELYIEEWLLHHRAWGFDHIFLYDNSNNNALSYLNGKFDFVHVKHFPGKLSQYVAYWDFYSLNKMAPVWTAVLDCDEFLMLYKHENIHSFLDHRIRTSQDITSKLQLARVTINWFQFGNNNHIHYNPSYVLSRFTTRRAKASYFGKSISFLPGMHSIGIHCGDVRAGFFAVDGDGTLSDGRLNEARCDRRVTLSYGQDASVNHYHTKSHDEWAKKVHRGRADVGVKYDMDTWLHRINGTDFFDDRAWQWYQHKVLKNLSSVNYTLLQDPMKSTFINLHTSFI